MLERLAALLGHLVNASTLHGRHLPRLGRRTARHPATDTAAQPTASSEPQGNTADAASDAGRLLTQTAKQRA